MIHVGQSPLSLNDFSELIFKKNELALDAAALNKINTNFEFLKQFSSNKLIYGINTGFGPMAQYKVSEDNILQLQYNLIRSHSSGSGKLMTAQLSKALMIARLNSFMQAYSGVHTDVVELLKELINKDIAPCVFEHGGVGASGDLVQLAHLGLVLIGEGEVIFEDAVHPTMDIFNKFNIKPLSIHIREGLAILNGTSAMTGIGMLNIIQA
ncbi:MAG: aromatic amino acid ammonia-lyase, partial [Mucilaginibacter sp.]